MDLDTNLNNKSNLMKNHYIDHLQNIFLDKNTNISMYKMVFKQLLALVPRENNTLEFIEMITNLYNTRLSEERFNTEIKYLISIWVFIFVVGVVSNIYVIAVLSKVRQKIVYEIFCIGLAVTDLSILVFAVPITTLHYGMRTWIFGDVICRMVNFLVYVALFSSTMMLLILTTTRFMAVVFPWENRSFSTEKAKIACFIIWILGATFSSPVLIYYGISEENNSLDYYNSSSEIEFNNSSRLICHDIFPNEMSRTIYFVLVFVLTYMLPFKTIIIINAMIVNRLKREFGQKRRLKLENSENKVSSSFIHKSKASLRESGKRQRRSRVTKIVILVTMLYCVCWLPTQIVNVWYFIDSKSFPKTRGMQYIKFISQTLSFASACINPIVYSIMSDTFKKTQQRICPCCFQNPEVSTTIIYDLEDKKDIDVKPPIMDKRKCSLDL